MRASRALSVDEYVTLDIARSIELDARFAGLSLGLVDVIAAFE
jgi:hypothetical protein